MRIAAHPRLTASTANWRPSNFVPQMAAKTAADVAAVVGRVVDDHVAAPDKAGVWQKPSQTDGAWQIGQRERHSVGPPCPLFFERRSLSRYAGSAIDSVRTHQLMSAGHSVFGKRTQRHVIVGSGFCGFGGVGQDEISVVADGVILKYLTEWRSRSPIQTAVSKSRHDWLESEPYHCR